jgi:hypothetical protein
MKHPFSAKWVIFFLGSLLGLSCKGEITNSSLTDRFDSGSGSRATSDGGKTIVGCPSCRSYKVGLGGQAFDPIAHESECVTQDVDGSLVLDKKKSSASRFLWIADTNLPGVVKIDLDTLTIVGRYITGGGSPSRTTVNVLGEAFIGARVNGKTKTGVTKILPLGANCPDTNGDGVITTSTGPDDVLPYGKDDCVAWHTETEGDIRGLAAQDIAG